MGFLNHRPIFLEHVWSVNLCDSDMRDSVTIFTCQMKFVIVRL